MQRIPPGERLILPLDVPTVADAKALVRRVEGAVSFFKVGFVLQMAGGQELVEWLIEQGHKVFLDYKLFDIEETVKEAVRRVAALGVTFLTVHGNARIIRAAVDGRGEGGLKLLAVTVLTSLDASDIREMGFPCSLEELVLHRASKALEAGCDGVVASGREATAIRQIAGSKLLIVTPGIRPSGTDAGEQKRTVTPEAAIRAGADYLVVGRPIRDAPDPRAVAEGIIAEIERALSDSRS
jgi:orotidine-5'-phosphate decarboxylase